MTVFKAALFALVAFFMQLGIAIAEDGKPAPQTKDGAEGIWQTKMGKSHVKIVECGKELCNEIVWLRQPNDKAGKPHTDKLNVVKSLRGRPIMGLAVLSNTARVGKGYWRGRIYDPERGKSFMAIIKLLSPQKLQVKGCLSMGPPFCKTHVWTKIASLEEYEAAQSQKQAAQ